MPTAISIRDVTILMGRRLALPVLALAGFLMICMAGYVWLEGVRWVAAIKLASIITSSENSSPQRLTNSINTLDVEHRFGEYERV